MQSLVGVQLLLRMRLLVVAVVLVRLVALLPILVAEDVVQVREGLWPAPAGRGRVALRLQRLLLREGGNSGGQQQPGRRRARRLAQPVRPRRGHRREGGGGVGRLRLD